MVFVLTKRKRKLGVVKKSLTIYKKINKEFRKVLRVRIHYHIKKSYDTYSKS